MKRWLPMILAALLVASPAPSADPTTQDAPVRGAGRLAAQNHYRTIVDAYMNGKWTELTEALKKANRYTYGMTRRQRRDIAYIRKAAAACRPPWWNNCKSLSNTSFEATIWNRKFFANYVPSAATGVQTPVAIRDGKLVVIVSWRPSFVDNPRPAVGRLAERHGITKGHLGEAIVWHELGHNYVSYFLPVEHVLELYVNHRMLAHHLQEFYADLTSLYHCSPPARRALLMMRIAEVETDHELEPHGRAARCIGSLILAKVLGEPGKWPSVHLPGKVPDKDVERKTILYVYRNLDPGWTLTEDIQLRTFISSVVKAQGEKVLRSKGLVMLPNRLKMNLVEPADRDLQAEREAWIAEQLRKAVDAGRADKQPPAVGDGEYIEMDRRSYRPRRGSS